MLFSCSYYNCITRCVPIILVETYKLLVALLEYFTVNSDFVDLGKLLQILATLLDSIIL